MADYTPVTAFDAFGRYMTIGGVEEECSLILLVGGTRDGWVYDLKHVEQREVEDGVGVVRYEDVGELARLADGRIARIFAPAVSEPEARDA